MNGFNKLECSLHKVKKACQRQTLLCIVAIRKLQRKYSLVNTNPEECYVIPIEEKVCYEKCDEI
jgi:hypothetical protein